VKFTRHMSHPLDGTFFSKKKVPESPDVRDAAVFVF
jgi:hypothetical protein